MGVASLLSGGVDHSGGVRMDEIDPWDAHADRFDKLITMWDALMERRDNDDR